jgi:pimeloyl-ACP methyl ester carboxylesterase
MISMSLNHARFIWLLLILTAPIQGCLKATKPNLPRIFPSLEAERRPGKNPVIVIPGVLGSRLFNRRTGEQVWPSISVNHDDSLALPITGPTLAENTDDIIATEAIETLRLARLIPEISVYDSLLLALERYGGYRRGNFEAPAENGDRDTFYVFAYDWRRDNVESAQLLARKIAALKERLRRPDLRFDIVAHSMGGLVARYYAMYGDHDVLTSAAPRPDWSGARNVSRLIMIGTPNGGSMDALHTLLSGYSVTDTNRPRLNLLKNLDQDVTFTAPSVYQLLPSNSHARFLDAKLSPIKVDFFDIETWRRFGWSVAFEAEARLRERRALVKRQGEIEGAEEAERLAATRERFLRMALARAVAFHGALDAPGAPPEALRLYLFGGDCEATLDAAMIATINGQPRTLFRSGKALGGRQARRRAFEAMFTPGDGRVTRRSLFELQPEIETNGQSASRLKPQPFHITFNCEVHSDLPFNLTLQDNLLTVLLGNRY